MSTTTDFIAELIRAGNDVGKLRPFEKRLLIERAVMTVKEMRMQVAFSSRVPPVGEDALLEIASVGADVAAMPDEVVSHAFLEAADMIRTLKVVLDAKDEVFRESQ